MAIFQPPAGDPWRAKQSHVSGKLGQQCLRLAFTECTELPRLTSYKDSKESRNTSPPPFLLGMVSGAHVARPWATLQRIPEGTTKKVQLRRLVEGGTSVVCAEHPLSLSRGGTANPGANREPVFQLPRKQGALCVSGTDRP